ncbi:MAG: metallophosphoesterase family protein [Flavobacteriaceae bacterium]|nr:metallophosphoesterase family protein [Flavobacteriaceae bacterium]MBL6680897.1 metallophosphoesterase family protein [Flavobacteriaceae bacterium]
MKKVLVISDTHSYIDDRIIKYASEADYVIHAGDIGTFDVIRKLKSVSRVLFVYGNIDGNEIRSESNKFEFFELNNLKILLTHISGKTPKYNKETLIKIKKHNPDLLIAGHSHILKIQYDKINQLIFLNPGAAGRHGFHLKRTMLRFEIKLNKIENLEIIELGSRSDLS